MQQEMIFLPAAPKKEKNNFYSFLTGRNVARVHAFQILKIYLKRKNVKLSNPSSKKLIRKICKTSITYVMLIRNIKFISNLM